MITKKILQNINDCMQKRNNVSGSMLGYNYTDKKSFELYQHGITDQQALSLCIKLKKYANKQLNVTEEELMNAENYYRNLIDSSKDRLIHERPFINIRMVHNDYSYITFKYNKAFIQILKDYGGSWLPKKTVWKLDNEYLDEVLDHLEKQGGNISGCLKEINSNHHEKFIVI